MQKPKKRREGVVKKASILSLAHATMSLLPSRLEGQRLLKPDRNFQKQVAKST